MGAGMSHLSGGQLLRLQQVVGNRAVVELLARQGAPPPPAPVEPPEPATLGLIPESESIPALQEAMNRAAAEAIASWGAGASLLDGPGIEALIRSYALDSGTTRLSLERAVQIVEARVRSAIEDWCPARIAERAPAPEPQPRRRRFAFIRWGRSKQAAS